MNIFFKQPFSKIVSTNLPFANSLRIDLYIHDTILHIHDTILHIHDTILHIDDTILHIHDTILHIDDIILHIHDTILHNHDTILHIHDTILHIHVYCCESLMFQTLSIFTDRLLGLNYQRLSGYKDINIRKLKFEATVQLLSN